MMEQLTLFKTSKNAIISDCGKYRYWLERTWNMNKPPILWIMLNPSTADADIDDPTIRRCMGFANKWGYGGIYVVNLYAYRATDKNVLSEIDDPVGEKNLLIVNSFCQDITIVAGYGNPPNTKIMSPIFKLLEQLNLYCLGTTKEGNPKHPLYIPKNQELIEFKIN